MQTIQNSLSQQNKKFRFYIIVFGFVIMGVALATACFYALDKSSLMQLSFVSDYLSDKRLASNPTDILFSSFVTGTLFLIFPFVLGFCAVSKPVLYLIPIFRGIGLGTAICSLYYQLGYKGIIVALVTVIPSSVIMTYALAVGIREASCISGYLFSVMFTDRNYSGMINAVKLYCVKFLVLEAVTTVGAAVDALSIFLFSNFI